MEKLLFSCLPIFKLFKIILNFHFSLKNFKINKIFSRQICISVDIKIKYLLTSKSFFSLFFLSLPLFSLTLSPTLPSHTKKWASSLSPAPSPSSSPSSSSSLSGAHFPLPPFSRKRGLWGISRRSRRKERGRGVRGGHRRSGVPQCRIPCLTWRGTYDYYRKTSKLVAAFSFFSFFLLFLFRSFALLFKWFFARQFIFTHRRFGMRDWLEKVCICIFCISLSHVSPVSARRHCDCVFFSNPSPLPFGPQRPLTQQSQEISTEKKKSKKERRKGKENVWLWERGQDEEEQHSHSLTAFRMISSPWRRSICMIHWWMTGRQRLLWRSVLLKMASVPAVLHRPPRSTSFSLWYDSSCCRMIWERERKRKESGKKRERENICICFEWS